MTDLSTRTIRRNRPRAKSRRWARLARGRALGYRRPGDDPGTWEVRIYVGNKQYKTRALGTADDLQPADGDSILSYGQAVTMALAATVHDADEDAPTGPLTVRSAVESYLAWYKLHRRSHDQLRYLVNAHILPELGDLRLDGLTAGRLRTWHEKLAASPARLRGGASKARRIRIAVTDDQKRARKVTANHALVALKSALNRAWEEHPEINPDPWRRVKPFKGVDVARARYLDSEEIRRLLNSCEPDLRLLVRAAILTGCRYAELGALTVEDFRPEAQAIHLRQTKTTPRFVYLGTEGLSFFEQLTAGKAPQEIIFRKADSTRWGRNHQGRRMQVAVEAAKIPGPLGFHQLRHTYASHYLMSGGSLIALSKQLGHSTTRMVEKHYGHLADAWRAAEAQAHEPKIRTPQGSLVRLRQVDRGAGSA